VTRPADTERLGVLLARYEQARSKKERRTLRRAIRRLQDRLRLALTEENRR